MFVCIVYVYLYRSLRFDLRVRHYGRYQVRRNLYKITID